MPATRDTIVQVAARHREQVRAGERAALERIERLYRAVEQGLLDDLRRIEGRVGDLEGKDVSVSDLRSHREVSSLLAEARARADRFAAQLAGEVRSHNVASVRLGASHADQLLKIEVGTSLRGLNASTIEEIAGITAPGSPLRRLIDAIPGASIANVERVLVTSFARGDGPDTLQRRIRSEVSALDIRRARTISRNESLRAHTGAQSATYKENDDVVIGMEIHSALDARTCPLCWARHGTILKPGETLARHVCCRCILLPVTRYSKLGKTGTERFAELAPIEQRRILQSGRYELYREGLPLGSISEEVRGGIWGPTIVPRTLKELRSLPKGDVPAQVRTARKVIREAMQLNASPIQRASARQVKIGLEAAAKTFSEVRLEPRAVSVQRSIIRVDGVEAFGVHTRDQIRIAIVDQNPVALTTAHEVGHAILTDAVYPFRDLGNGPAIRELASALDTPERRRTIEAYARSGVIARDDAEYLLSEEESIARALGQYAISEQRAMSVDRLAIEGASGEYWSEAEYDLWKEAMAEFCRKLRL